MSDRLARYTKAREDRLQGKYNGAPLYFDFPRLGSIVPVIEKGRQIMILGGSGSGKSQSWVSLILLPIYSLIKTKGYKAKFFIYLLEDTKELLEDRLFCRILYTKFGIIVDPLDLNSLKQELLPEDVLSKFSEVDAIVEDILSYCVIEDNLGNPTGCYKDVRSKSELHGTHTWEDREFTYKNDDGSVYTKPVKVYKEYIPNDPDFHGIVILDNLNNLAEEYDRESKTKSTVHGSISKWCRDYARLQICKNFKFTVVNVMQQSLEYDKKQFDMRGENIIDKVKPTLNSLGDNKLVARDMHLILGLFAPDRFGISTYQGYNISKLKDNYRSIIILKSNFSQANIEVPFFFLGSSSYFSELPKVENMTTKEYEKYSINAEQLKKIANKSTTQ